MKKAALFLLILFLAGCSSNSDTYPDSPGMTSKPTVSHIQVSKTPAQENYEQVNELHIIYPEAVKEKYMALGNWQNYFNATHGKEIFIHYPKHTEGPESPWSYSEAILYLHNDSEFLSFSGNVMKYATPEYAHELSSYYTKYEWNQYIDQEFLDRLSVNGGIYAVPAYSHKFINPRYYRSEFLNALGMEVPETVFELQEYLQAVKNLKNNADDYYPMIISEQRLTRMSSDIFRAFGAYVHSDSESAVAFDPNTGAVEDAVFSPDFESALGYMKNLQSEGLLFVSGPDEERCDGTFTTLFDGKIYKICRDFATEYRCVFGENASHCGSAIRNGISYDYEVGYYLAGTNTRNVCEVVYTPSFYIFPNKIENINGVMELFNQLFTDSRYYADLKYGVENTDYNVSGGKIISQEPLTGSFVNLRQVIPTEDYDASVWPPATKILNDISSELKYENNVFTQVDQVYDVFQYKDSNYFGFSHPGFFDSLFNKNVSAYDAIEFYKEQFYKSGNAAILHEINERLGYVSSYDYSGN